jgi:hypothetical protein
VDAECEDVGGAKRYAEIASIRLRAGEAGVETREDAGGVNTAIAWM